MRLRLGVSALVMLGLAQSAVAGSFDRRGMWRFDEHAVFTQGFERAQDLIDQGVSVYTRRGDTVATDEVTLSGFLTSADGTAIEGQGYWQSPRGRMGPATIVLPLPADIDGRVEVRMWTRAQPGTANVALIYGQPNQQGYMTGYVIANPTGRRTSDEWIEQSTGPIDSKVLGVGISAITITSGFSDFVVDAVELVKVGPRLIPDVTDCLPATAQAVCGAHGECVFGACVDEKIVWGAAPLTQPQREEYTQRLAHIFRHMHGNRHSATHNADAFQAALERASASDSSRDFYSGLAKAVFNFRDQHTSAPGTYSGFYGSFPSSMGGENSGGLGACFGVTDLDLRGGARGYTVFRTDPTRSALDTPLQVGDILVAVDGEPIEQWVRQLPGFGSNAPSDPRSDISWNALDLAGSLTTRAGKITVLRCESTTTCAAPTTVNIEVASTLRTKLLATGNIYDVVQPFQCDGRFSNSVTTLAPPDEQGYDVVSYERRDGVATFQFDGFSGNEAWNSAFQNGLADHPALALFDARLGNGGFGESAQFLVDQLRDHTSPRSALGSTREWDETDTASYIEDLLVCLEPMDEASYFNACSGTITFVTTDADALGLDTKVAWLNTADVSANDYTPRMLKGRRNLRMFGPTPTSGAFGAITSLPPLMPGEYSGGSMQIHDTRFANDTNGLATARFESGTGVEPDEVVTQKLSDSLQGLDTMQARALAWLREMP